jgi:putative transposase
VERTVWHHGPEHRFQPGQVYMVTGATLYKKHFFRRTDQLRLLQQVAFGFAEGAGWKLHSWSFFSNHYHLVAHGLPNSLTLSRFVQGFHSKSAIELNRFDSKPGRTIWYEFWDRALTFESSYYARRNYVNNNPVHHGLVPVASQYPFCSASFYEIHLPDAFLRKLSSYKYDQVREVDDFEPLFFN